jgi:rRNA processing protein Krr1/Pno1
MKIRLTGLPAEIDQAVSVINDAQALDVIEVSNPYPNRGDSRQVRVYIEAQLHPDGEAVP